MGYGAFDVLPKSFSDFLIAHVAEKVASAMESTIWTGVNATAGQFAGLSTQIAADAALPSAQEVAGTTVTASNVITELGKFNIEVLVNFFSKISCKFSYLVVLQSW